MNKLTVVKRKSKNMRFYTLFWMQITNSGSKQCVDKISQNCAVTNLSQRFENLNKIRGRIFFILDVTLSQNRVHYNILK